MLERAARRSTRSRRPCACSRTRRSSMPALDRCSTAMAMLSWTRRSWMGRAAIRRGGGGAARAQPDHAGAASAGKPGDSAGRPGCRALRRVAGLALCDPAELIVERERARWQELLKPGQIFDPGRVLAARLGDTETGRQGDKETSNTELSRSPLLPVSLSPLLPRSRIPAILSAAWRLIAMGVWRPAHPPVAPPTSCRAASAICR